MNLSRFGLVIVAALAIAMAAAGVAQTGPGPAAPPVPSPSASAPASSAPPSSAPRRGRRAPDSGASTTPDPAASDTPEPPQFTSLDGSWEIELQPLDGTRTQYSHLTVIQVGNNISGTWQHDPSNTSSPFSGTFDGRLFSLTITELHRTVTMSGYSENFGDLVGLLKMDAKDQGTPFTAQHRKKSRG